MTARVFAGEKELALFEEGLCLGTPIVEEGPAEKLAVRCLSLIANNRSHIEALLGFIGRPAPFMVKLELLDPPLNLNWKAAGEAAAKDMRARGLTKHALDKADERTSARRYDVHRVTPQHVLVQDTLEEWEKHWARMYRPLPAQQRDDLCNRIASLLCQVAELLCQTEHTVEKNGAGPTQEKVKGRRVLAIQDANNGDANMACGGGKSGKGGKSSGCKGPSCGKGGKKGYSEMQNAYPKPAKKGGK